MERNHSHRPGPGGSSRGGGPGRAGQKAKPSRGTPPAPRPGGGAARPAPHPGGGPRRGDPRPRRRLRCRSCPAADKEKDTPSACPSFKTHTNGNVCCFREPDQPFTEPAVRLALTCSWKMANTMMLGSTAMVMAANMAV